jgi:hypothetical protein
VHLRVKRTNIYLFIYVDICTTTFPCVEKFQTALACIYPDVSAARPDDSQCSTSFRISFQNTVMGKSLQPSGRRGFPSGRAHPKGKYRIQNPDVRTPVSMVWMRMHQIWKLCASNQPSRRSSPWSGRAKPLYGNYLQWKCDRLDDRAPLSGHGSETGRNFNEILEKSIAQLSVRMARDYRSDDT